MSDIVEKGSYNPRDGHLGFYELPEMVDEGLEFAFVRKDAPHFTDGIDPVVGFKEEEDRFLVSFPGTLQIFTKEVMKDDLISWELRKFTRDEYGKSPPPNKV